MTMHYHLLVKRPLVIAILLLLCFSAHAQTASPKRGDVKDGVNVRNGLYCNLFFAFCFNYPKDWVVHPEEINERIEERAQKEAKSRSESEALKNTHLLLSVTRYPRGGQPGISLNPAILVFAEKIAHVPGTPNGRDYLLSLREERLKRGLQPLLNEPVQFRVAGLQFFRDDYRHVKNGVHAVQHIFVNVKRGYALIFSFLGEDHKSVGEMAKAMDTILPVGTGGGCIPARKPN